MILDWEITLSNTPDEHKDAIEFVKILRVKAGGYRQLFVKLYGREPTKDEVKNLGNYVTRGNYNTKFMNLLIDAFELENVTLGEFFKGKTK